MLIWPSLIGSRLGQRSAAYRPAISGLTFSTFRAAGLLSNCFEPIGIKRFWH